MRQSSEFRWEAEEARNPESYPVLSVEDAHPVNRDFEEDLRHLGNLSNRFLKKSTMRQ